MGRGAKHVQHKQRAARPRGNQVSLANKAQRAALHAPRKQGVPRPPRAERERERAPGPAPPRPRGPSLRLPPWLQRVGRGTLVAWVLVASSVLGVLGALIPPGNPAHRVLSLALVPGVLTAVGALVASMVVPYAGGRRGEVRHGTAGPGTLTVQLRERMDPIHIGFGVLIPAMIPAMLLAMALLEWLGVPRANEAGPHLGMLAGTLLAALAARVQHAGSEVAFERDALVVPAGWGERRAVPYASIVAVEPSARWLDLRLAGGGRMPINWRALGDADRARLEREVRDRVPARAPVPEPAPVPVPEVASERFALLDRAGRSLAQWREAVRELLAREEGYRQLPVSREDILRVLADPDTPVERRIAAALALVANRDPEASARVRAAIDAAPSRPVRVALGRVLRDELDDKALDRAVSAARTPPPRA